MIDLHYWPTPNGKKITVALEELELGYRVLPVNIGRGDQFKPEFLAIAPNNRMPAIVDHEPADGGEPVSVFESGAILIYLADKTGKLLPNELRARTAVLEWLMWQMGGVGPMFGQANHFVAYAPEKLPYAIDRYMNEAKRLLRVLNTRLEGREFVADSYSIADIAIAPWVISARERLVKEFGEYPNVARWTDALMARPAFAKGMAVAVDAPNPGIDEEARKHLFGQK
jgi:GST-like protein